MAVSGIKTNVPDFKKQVRTMARITGKNVSKVMEQQVGIVGGSLMRAFPPKTKGVGKQAIENDLKKIIIPFDDIDLLHRWDDALNATHDVIDPDGVRIQDWHENRRNKRTGRTRAVQGYKYAAGRKFSNKLHVPQKALNQYTKRRAQKVGNLKAGWIPTARLNSKTRIPAWIGNQQKSGSVRNNMNPKTGGGSIKFSNNVNHASRWKRTNDFILRQNGKRMVRALKAEYRKSIKQANAGTK